jgi:methylenetetrahydrofolate reductase (NADPH)
MKNQVPGLLVADEYIDRMTAAGAEWADIPKEDLTPEDKKARSSAWRAEGMQICIELIQQVREIEGVSGAHIMAIEWEEAVGPIAEGAGLLPRPTIAEPAH